MNSIPDAEALYVELLRGVKSLMRPDTRLVGVTSGGAWLVERLQKDLGLAGAPGIISSAMAVAGTVLPSFILKLAPVSSGRSPGSTDGFRAIAPSIPVRAWQQHGNENRAKNKGCD